MVVHRQYWKTVYRERAVDQADSFQQKTGPAAMLHRNRATGDAPVSTALSPRTRRVMAMRTTGANAERMDWRVVTAAAFVSPGCTSARCSTLYGTPLARRMLDSVRRSISKAINIKPMRIEPYREVRMRSLAVIARGSNHA